MRTASLPRAIETFVFNLSGWGSVVVRHWRPRDAKRCDRCELCTAHPAYGIMVCAVIVDTDDVAATCFD